MYAACAVVFLGLTIAMALGWRELRGRAGLSRFAAGYVRRGREPPRSSRRAGWVPAFFVDVVANVLLVAAAALILDGTRLFCGLPRAYVAGRLRGGPGRRRLARGSLRPAERRGPHGPRERARRRRCSRSRRGRPPATARAASGCWTSITAAALACCALAFGARAALKAVGAGGIDPARRRRDGGDRHARGDARGGGLDDDGAHERQSTAVARDRAGAGRDDAPDGPRPARPDGQHHRCARPSRGGERPVAHGPGPAADGAPQRGRQNALIDSILDIWQLEEGAFPQRRTSVAVGTLVGDALRLAGPPAQARRLALEAGSPATFPKRGWIRASIERVLGEPRRERDQVQPRTGRQRDVSAATRARTASA